MIGWMPEPAELVGEFERAEHVVGVGQRQRRLAVGLGELGEPRDRQRALEQRIGRVHVQMHETGVCHAESSGESLSARWWGSQALKSIAAFATAAPSPLSLAQANTPLSHPGENPLKRRHSQRIPGASRNRVPGPP